MGVPQAAVGNGIRPQVHFAAAQKSVPTLPVLLWSAASDLEVPQKERPENLSGKRTEALFIHQGLTTGPSIISRMRFRLGPCRPAISCVHSLFSSAKVVTHVVLTTRSLLLSDFSRWQVCLVQEFDLLLIKACLLGHLHLHLQSV